MASSGGSGFPEQPTWTEMTRRLPWLEPGDPFPPTGTAWGPEDAAPGLLAAGGALDVASLQEAYRNGIFPWFSDGQPILWWSPDPRMVLPVEAFRLHRSLRRTIRKFALDARCEIRIDHDFDAVIAACSGMERAGQDGTWIVPEMVRAYGALHRAGHAHSVETWIDGELVGGLYCINIGGAVFGESMFSRRSDASKIALSALVAICLRHGVRTIDCQQNTRHLASLGAVEIPRSRFVAETSDASMKPSVEWKFEPLYWRPLLHRPPSA